MNRLRGSVDRQAAAEIDAMLRSHGVPTFEPFWKGYRDATRELGLMIRTNGLPLALMLAIGKAEIKDKGFSAASSGEEASGRAKAVVDLFRRITPAAVPTTLDDLMTLVRDTTTAAPSEYSAMTNRAMTALVWQKTLSTARTAPNADEKPAKSGGESAEEPEEEGEAP